MIAHSIKAAQRSELFDHILVSTDDEEIAAVAEAWGAEVPFRRPAELANDVAGTTEVIAHGVRWCDEEGWPLAAVCCIYATAPLLQPETLRTAFAKMAQTGKSFCFPVTAFEAPIQRALKLVGDGIEMFDPTFFHARSQDLAPAYHDAGQFYWGTPEAWREQRLLFSDAATVITLPKHLTQDIDTMEDWLRAEMLYAALQLGSSGR
jgi:pseudaminic acid cytidylyltransferase